MDNGRKKIRRRDFLTSSAALGALAGISGGLVASAGSLLGKSLPDRAPPNIILLLADDMRWDAIGALGNRIIHTPHLDALTSRSALFSNFFVTTSICPTSRASILTGQYARRHGIWDFNLPLSVRALEQSFPALLRKGGYHTGFIGKWGIGNFSPMPNWVYNFWRGFPGQGEYYAPGTPKHLTDRQAEQAEEFLNTAPRDKPFALQLSFKAPHGPFDPDRRFNVDYNALSIPRAPTDTPEHFARIPQSLKASHAHFRWEQLVMRDAGYEAFIKNYYRLITGIDAAVGAIVAQLRRLDLERNTFILFTSDNGFMAGEHGLWGKWCMYEESIRVPMIMYVPEAYRSSQRANRVASELTLNIDIAPTLLDLAGVAVPHRMQGASMLPLLAGDTAQWRKDFFYEHFFDYFGHLPSCEGVRDTRWKYARYQNHEEMLFDLTNDPLEENNLTLSQAHAAQLAAMRQRLRAIPTIA